MKLNKCQTEAVQHLNGTCLVTSSPGSGKTRVLVERTINLIKQDINPINILCLTFTNKAANEMKERVRKRLGLKKVDFFIGTFHSLCASLLRKIGNYSGYSSNFTILDERDQMDLIFQVARLNEFDIDRGSAYRVSYAVNYYREQLEDFSWVEDKLGNPTLIDVARGYLTSCRENNLIDFSGLIYEAIKIIEKNKDVRDKLQNTFKYILVDEAQDTNQSQFHLINLLGGKWKNIMLVSDTDQSIYGWRGARYQNIKLFLEKYSDCKVIALSKNYRSTPQIISVAGKLIKHNKSHIDIKFETDNKDGEPVKCYKVPNQLKEAGWVANRIKRLINEGGWEPSDMAILYRMNKMSEPLEKEMTLGGIPYEVIGGWNFYDRKEVKDTIAMLRFLMNRKDGVAFHRLCKLMPGVGDITIGKIEKRAKEKDINLVEASYQIGTEINSVKVRDACRKISSVYKSNFDFANPPKCIMTLVDKFGFRSYLKAKYPEDKNDRNDNVDQFIDASGIFVGEKNGIDKFLQQISLITSSDKEMKENKVSLMTLHSAKGLEYPIIFMVGVEQGILPHQRAVDENLHGESEERRLCYVGMTRAKKLLYITWCNSRIGVGGKGFMRKRKATYSQFLIEAGLIKEEDF
ncbi:hypothetical protein LCGC14_1739880 [marine sediment metagenome]|uniref:DNA 3'-5' helicase n=1 Tax=marine sediment metagenome TaxID=412755 RepID=A0A0F9H737_9ZZZZ